MARFVSLFAVVCGLGLGLTACSHNGPPGGTDMDPPGMMDRTMPGCDAARPVATTCAAAKQH